MKEYHKINSIYKRDTNGKFVIGKAPKEIHNVTGSYFSIARYYGGCKAFGADYVYIPAEDKLIRSDLVKKYKKKDFSKMDRKKEFQPELL